MKNFNGLIFLFVIVLILSSCSREKLPLITETETKYNLSSEKDLENPAHIEAIDSLYDWGTEGVLDGANGVKIYYKYFLQLENEEGAIVISSGRTEAAIKYKEVIFDLFNNGYSVYIHDHRGQGFSGRMLPDPEMGYVDKFQNYVNDMKYFYDNVVKKVPHKNIFLLAHSLGGAIGVTYLEQHPRDFTAAAFSSPMLELPFPTCLVISILIGGEPEYAPQNGSYEENKEPFEENTLTTSKMRFDIMNKVFDQNPKVRLGGATYQWVDKSCEQFDFIFDNLNKIETPLILFSAGNEEIVEPDSHAEFIEELQRLGKKAVGYTVPNAKHELLIEKDEIRNPVLTILLDFFEKN